MLIRIVLPALALAVAAPAFAEPDYATVTVAYGDLDLTTESGRKALDERLVRATRKVCGGAVPMRNLAMVKLYHDCIAEARTSYQAQVELALTNANARRVAVLATKIGLLASF